MMNSSSMIKRVLNLMIPEEANNYERGGQKESKKKGNVREVCLS